MEDEFDRPGYDPNGNIRKNCIRCGLVIYVNPRAKLKGLCRDCRTADHPYTAAVTNGRTLR